MIWGVRKGGLIGRTHWIAIVGREMFDYLMAHLLRQMHGELRTPPAWLAALLSCTMQTSTRLGRLAHAFGAMRPERPSFGWGRCMRLIGRRGCTPTGSRTRSALPAPSRTVGFDIRLRACLCYASHAQACCLNCPFRCVRACTCMGAYMCLRARVNASVHASMHACSSAIVYKCVCEHVCRCALIYVWLYECVYTCMNECIHAYMYGWIDVLLM